MMSGLAGASAGSQGTESAGGELGMPEHSKFFAGSPFKFLHEWSCRFHQQQIHWQQQPHIQVEYAACPFANLNPDKLPTTKRT
jgi:hypothetical protein